MRVGASTQAVQAAAAGKTSEHCQEKSYVWGLCSAAQRSISCRETARNYQDGNAGAGRRVRLCIVALVASGPRNQNCACDLPLSACSNWRSPGLAVKGCSSIGRASVSKTEGWGFEPLHPCQSRASIAHLAAVERPEDGLATFAVTAGSSRGRAATGKSGAVASLNRC